MPRKSKIEKTEENVVEPVVIEKPKRGRKKKVQEPVATAEPDEESVPAPVPKKRVRKSKKVQEVPVVVEEVKEEVKSTRKPRALKVEKSSDAKSKRAPSRWVLHVQEFRKKNEGMSYRDALRKAKDSYSR